MEVPQQPTPETHVAPFGGDIENRSHIVRHFDIDYLFVQSHTAQGSPRTTALKSIPYHVAGSCASFVLHRLTTIQAIRRGWTRGGAVPLYKETKNNAAKQWLDPLTVVVVQRARQPPLLSKTKCAHVSGTPILRLTHASRIRCASKLSAVPRGFCHKERGHRCVQRRALQGGDKAEILRAAHAQTSVRVF